MLWLCVPYAVICVITFTTPEYSPSGKLLYAYITYSLLIIIYTAINIPYCALGGVITPDTQERVSLNSYRFFWRPQAGFWWPPAHCHWLNGWAEATIKRVINWQWSFSAFWRSSCFWPPFF